VFEQNGIDMKSQWIGPDENLTLGDVGFLIEFSNPMNGGYERFELRDTPACRNQSRKPLLNGWCGSYNDLSTNAHGMGKVVRIAKNKRCLIEPLEGDELQAALADLGYPDLCEAD
jgi:hypothetical protein